MQRISSVRRALLGAFGASLVPRAFAQRVDTYPDRVIKLINPWTPGGPGETVGRPIADILTKAWKQPVILDHRPGANAVIGSAIVARSAPDGYTLLLGQTGPNTISPSIGKGTPYDPIKDFAPITQVTSAALVLAVRADLPIHNIADLITYAKAHPTALSFGSVGAGSTTHLAGEMLKAAGSFQMTHVPYKGAGPVMNDLLGGQISMTFLNIAGIVPHMSSGRIRPIAVTTLKRSPQMSDVPAIAETLPGVEMVSWYALLAPGGTPPAIVDKIYRAVVEGLRQPEVAAIYRAAGQELELSTPAQFEQRIKSEIAKFAKLVKDNNITTE
ncbi:Bug family tripartite tricarboxylate transporter substrate binding protein [Variovorax sp. RA8]|uniref:Bug family tripartite tricarboxylate transporter substrate binding protein n=1 Tax=Variovorax sp. (strain JCM 16519 / RA8) TaxID=662548 RepID=UPI001318AF18|nr:tripartite tricarboxylate transporter substrate binding protein [Variovorax sp. RA8]VTU16164.1 Argininosuccinate lyase [Variovorax sp. RA8]